MHLVIYNIHMQESMFKKCWLVERYILLASFFRRIMKYIIYYSSGLFITGSILVKSAISDYNHSFLLWNMYEVMIKNDVTLLTVKAVKLVCYHSYYNKTHEQEYDPGIVYKLFVQMLMRRQQSIIIIFIILIHTLLKLFFPSKKRSMIYIYDIEFKNKGIECKKVLAIFENKILSYNLMAL
ncbi:hypothetical protein KUTeg_016677, partial [Tegillarca granosa]